MKTNKLVVAVIAVLLSSGAYAQTVDEIVDKHVAALGGLEKLNAVTNITTERSLAVNGMEIPSKTILVVGKSIRTESTVMGNSMLQVYDGGKGWMVMPTMMGGTGEPQDMPADQLKQTVSQLDPFGALVNYKEKGNKVELVGKEKSDKKDVYHLKVMTKEGQALEEYLDATTFLVSKVKTTANGQDIEIGFSDYKEVDGVKFPNTMDMTSQMGPLTFITNKVIVNSKIDEAVFKKPMK